MRSFYPAALAALLLVPTAGALAQEGDALFRQLPADELSPEQQAQLELYEADPAAAVVRVVRVDSAAARSAERMNFNMAPGLDLSMSMGRIDSRAVDDYTWYGEDAESGASAVLVVQGEDMVGTVRAEGKLYRVRPLGDGLHAVIEVDPAALPDDHPPEYEELERQEMPPEAGEAARDFARSADLTDACDTIDLIVAYTPAARRAAGNIDGLLRLAVDETNQSYVNSEITPRVRLVHSYETDYVESGSLSTDRIAFRVRGDATMDEIHDLRDRHGGDVALLIVARSHRGCGLASAILANASNPFAVVRQDCATGNYSFGHEIGHLQGARHNPEADPNVSPFPHGHGLLFVPRRWRTVMSYDCDPSCGALRRMNWSNPAVRIDGVATGSAATHHNARVLDETACMVANFRPAPLRLVLEPQRLTLAPGATGTLTARVEDAGAGLPGVAIQLASSDPAVASVGSAVTTDATGQAPVQVRAGAAGTAEVRAEALDVQGQATVEVRDEAPAGSLAALTAMALAAAAWIWLRGRRRARS